MAEVVADRRRPFTGTRGLVGAEALSGGDGKGWVGRFFWGGGCERKGYAGAALTVVTVED